MLTDAERFAFLARRHHAFATTGNAYDAVQCDPRIAVGDTLVILAENTVGVAKTWPFAITGQSGQLHQIKEPAPAETLEKISCDLGISEADIRHALLIARALNFDLAPGFARFAPEAASLAS